MWFLFAVVIVGGVLAMWILMPASLPSLSARCGGYTLIWKRILHRSVQSVSNVPSRYEVLLMGALVSPKWSPLCASAWPVEIVEAINRDGSSLLSAQSGYQSVSSLSARVRRESEPEGLPVQVRLNLSRPSPPTLRRLRLKVTILDGGRLVSGRVGLNETGHIVELTPELKLKLQQVKSIGGGKGGGSIEAKFICDRPLTQTNRATRFSLMPRWVLVDERNSFLSESSSGGYSIIGRGSEYEVTGLIRYPPDSTPAILEVDWATDVEVVPLSFEFEDLPLQEMQEHRPAARR